ncbi:MAG: acyl carrier protein [Candidatus Eremiobacteraeota bacterium]|nr:acyl carrier protein [Candidatus Eremiobacteraeota bacterium]
MDSAQLRTFIVDWLTEQLGHTVAPEANFGALGMDSIDAVELTDALAEKLGWDDLPVSMILDHPSPRQLADQLASEREK